MFGKKEPKPFRLNWHKNDANGTREANYKSCLIILSPKTTGSVGYDCTVFILAPWRTTYSTIREFNCSEFDNPAKWEHMENFVMKEINHYLQQRQDLLNKMDEMIKRRKDESNTGN